MCGWLMQERPQRSCPRSLQIVPASTAPVSINHRITEQKQKHTQKQRRHEHAFTHRSPSVIHSHSAHSSFGVVIVNCVNSFCLASHIATIRWPYTSEDARLNVCELCLVFLLLPAYPCSLSCWYSITLRHDTYSIQRGSGGRDLCDRNTRKCHRHGELCAGGRVPECTSKACKRRKQRRRGG